jgi:hypothetical protein
MLPSTETVMGEHRLKGPPTRKVGDKAKGGAGKREGVFEQIKGKVQNAYGSIKGAIKRK